MEEDPYASMCQINSSQEETLQKCHFALHLEEEESPPPCLVQSTAIIMLSVPESNADYPEEDAFHTPEHHRSQSMSSSEDQGPEIRPDNPREVHLKDIGGREEEVPVGGGFKDAEMSVDLGKDSNTLGFSEPNFSKESGGSDSGNYVVGAVDLSKDETFQSDLKKNKVLESDGAHLVLGKCEVSTENLQSTSANVYLGDTEQIVIEGDNMEIGETEVVDLASEEICKEMRASVPETTEDVNELSRDGNSAGLSSSKNINDLDAFRYVPSRGTEKSGWKKSVLGRHGLRNLKKGPEENEGLVVKDKKTFKDLLNAARIVCDDIPNTNYLKTTKECGLSFYQPRWWPPEGFDDQVMD